MYDGPRGDLFGLSGTVEGAVYPCGSPDAMVMVNFDRGGLDFCETDDLIREWASSMLLGLGGTLVRKTARDNLPPSEFELAVASQFQRLESLLLRKHQDYGPHNIGAAPGGPLNGLRVRMWDKLARINNLIDTGALPENESLRDSFIDLANYAVIGLLVLDGEWPTG